MTPIKISKKEKGAFLKFPVNKEIKFAVISHNFSSCRKMFNILQGFFLDIVKKTQAQKNSKLKQNLEKTQAKSGKNLKTANSS